MAPQLKETHDVLAEDSDLSSFDPSPAKSELHGSSGKETKAKPEIWWSNGFFVILVHVVAFLTLYYLPLTWPRLMLVALVWVPSGFGITAGYHRLWSHQSYKAHSSVRMLLAILGTAAFQGSIRWWVLRHRIHHRFTDTEDDPYTIKKGFFFSHMGWIFIKPRYKKMKLIDASDLSADWVVCFQHKHYVSLALSFGVLLPTLFGALFFLPHQAGGLDFLGAFLYGGVVARLFIWHSTFCINSLAHLIGEREYDPTITAAGGMLVSLLTNGEGYHNFHHAYPNDYRNGIRWFDYDPTKWFITACWYLGLATDLNQSDKDEIEKVKILTAENLLKDKRQKYNWGPADADLPVVTMTELKEQVKEQHLERFVLDGYVIDVSGFKGQHPGGDKILRAFYGKDATHAFHGGLNIHSSGAISSMKMLRVAKIARD